MQPRLPAFVSLAGPARPRVAGSRCVPLRAAAGGAPSHPVHGSRERGFTLAELLVAVAITALLMGALGSVVAGAVQARSAAAERNGLARDGRFAMERMTRAVSASSRLVLPLPDNPATAWSESIRDPGVLAVTLSPTLDRDGDGFADADNDKDGAVDEDIGSDANNDGANGIRGIDDDNDGQVDEGGVDGSGLPGDDDEDGVFGEDWKNGVDEDGDAATDEDPKPDHNGDGQPGVAGVDDDGDGAIDEGPPPDDDEDGTNNEDWLDTIAFFLNGSQLVERMPNIDPVDGADYTERVIADDVASFRVERLAGAASDRFVVVDLALTLARGDATVTLATRVRVGAAQ